MTDTQEQTDGHTKGPWKIDFGHPRGLPGGISVAKGGRPVTRFNAFARPSTPEALANARLIAAAPEIKTALLDAVIALEALASAWPEDHMPSKSVCLQMADAINNGNAAIAKAIGQ